MCGPKLLPSATPPSPEPLVVNMLLAEGGPVANPFSTFYLTFQHCSLMYGLHLTIRRAEKHLLVKVQEEEIHPV